MKEKISWLLGCVVGGGLLAAHLVALPHVLQKFSRADLSVEVDLPLHTKEGKLQITAKIPAGVGPSFMVDEVPQSDTPYLRSGLRHLSWKVLYRGGFIREVGATILVGEPQTKEAPLCGARVVVHQNLLDDGTDNPGTFANVLKRLANEQMIGLTVPVLGSLQEIRSVEIWWSAATNKDPKALRILMEAAFEKGVVPLSFWLMPMIKDGELVLTRYASARVEGAGWLEKAAAFIVRGDSWASDIAQEQIDISGNMAQELLRRPPPVPLWEGTTIELAYCSGKDIEIFEREAAVIPLAVVLPAYEGVPAVSLSLPLTAPPLSDAPLSLDMSVEALNGVLHLLWARGYFEKALRQVGAKDWLNERAGQYSFLTLRVAELSLALPPVIEPRADGLPLSVGLEVAVGLQDREVRATSRLFSRFGLALSSGEKGVEAALSLLGMSLTCIEGKRLTPCYADLFAELKGHTSEIEGPFRVFLEGYLNRLLEQLRLEDPSLPVAFRIEQRRITSWREGNTSGVRLVLVGGLR